MNALTTDLKQPPTSTENNVSLTKPPTGTQTEETPQSIPSIPLEDRMVAGLNRMQVDEAFREEIASKLF
jgi:hypothetical protein